VIIRRSAGVVKQGGLSRSGVGRQECLQECQGKDALPSGGLDQAGKDTVGYQAGIRAGSESYFAEDHLMTERLFGMVIGGRDPY